MIKIPMILIVFAVALPVSFMSGTLYSSYVILEVLLNAECQAELEIESQELGCLTDTECELWHPELTTPPGTPL